MNPLEVFEFEKKQSELGGLQINQTPKSDWSSELCDSKEESEDFDISQVKTSQSNTTEQEESMLESETSQKRLPDEQHLEYVIRSSDSSITEHQGRRVSCQEAQQSDSTIRNSTSIDLAV